MKKLSSKDVNEFHDYLEKKHGMVLSKYFPNQKIENLEIFKDIYVILQLLEKQIADLERQVKQLNNFH